MDPLLLKSLEKLIADDCANYVLTINPLSGDFLLDTFVLKTKTLLLKKTKTLYTKYTIELVSDECEDDEYSITIDTLYKYILKSKMRDVLVISLDDDQEFEITPNDYEIDDDSESVIFNIVPIEEEDIIENKKASIDYSAETLDKEEENQEFVHIDYDIDLEDLVDLKADEEEEEEYDD